MRKNKENLLKKNLLKLIFNFLYPVKNKIMDIVNNKSGKKGPVSIAGTISNIKNEIILFKFNFQVLFKLSIIYV